MKKKKTEAYRGFQEAGIRLAEETLPDIVTHSSTHELPQLYACHMFDKAHLVALRLIAGANTFKEYTDENLRKPEILDLEAKINIVVDEALEKLPQSDHPAQLTIKLLDGTILQETVSAPRGSILNPMTDEEVSAKFRSFASGVIKDSAMERLIEIVLQMETVEDVRQLSLFLS